MHTLLRMTGSGAALCVRRQCCVCGRRCVQQDRELRPAAGSPVLRRHRDQPVILDASVLPLIYLIRHVRARAPVATPTPHRTPRSRVSAGQNRERCCPSLISVHNFDYGDRKRHATTLSDVRHDRLRCEDRDAIPHPGTRCVGETAKCDVIRLPVCLKRFSRLYCMHTVTERHRARARYGFSHHLETGPDGFGPDGK